VKTQVCLSVTPLLKLKPNWTKLWELISKLYNALASSGSLLVVQSTHSLEFRVQIQSLAALGGRKERKNGFFTFGQLGFSVSRVTDKKSSWILIYQNKNMSIHKSRGRLKLNEIKVWFKVCGIKLKRGIFNLQLVEGKPEPIIFRSFSKLLWLQNNLFLLFLSRLGCVTAPSRLCPAPTSATSSGRGRPTGGERGSTFSRGTPSGWPKSGWTTTRSTTTKESGTIWWDENQGTLDEGKGSKQLTSSFR